MWQIFNSLKKHDSKKKTFKPYIKYIKSSLNSNIVYENMNIIKSEDDYCYCLLSIAIIWSFNETSESKYTENKLKEANDSYSMIKETISFINSYKVWNQKENSLFLTQKEENSFIFKIFSILVNNNIIHSTTNYILWLKKKQINYSSSFFYKKKILKIYTKPLILKKNKNYSILFGDHYSSYWDMYIPNKESAAIFTLKENSIINIMQNMYTNIDFTILKKFYNLYIKENKIENIDLNKLYNLSLKELKSAIELNNKNLIATTGKQLSILQKALDLKYLLDENFNENTCFYLPWKYDFRGRVYFFSDISFTFNKEFRWCMFTGYYTKLEDLIPKWHFFNQKIYKILDNYIDKIDNLKINIKNNDNIFIKYILIFILISLAEINKTKLGIKINLEEFIKEGIKIFNTENLESYDYEEKIKIIGIKEIINDFSKDFNTDKIKKRLISKDAPASVFQHLILNFGWKNENLLTWCNLNSEDTWYDTYTFFINEWSKNYENKKIIHEYFNRKTLKKTIMTLNYGVGYNSAENYFKEIIFKLKKEDFDKETINNWPEIKKLFKEFFEFLSEWNLSETSPKKIIDYIKNNDGIIELSDALIDANYYTKNDSYIIDFINEKKRFTKYFTILTEELDDDKFKISIRANFVQSLDSALTRWLILRYPFYTIHDCFLVDYANMIYFMSLVNEGMNQRFHDFHKTWENEKKEIFSIFIVL